MFDKFGEQTKIEKLDENTYETKVKVIASDQFFGMLLGRGMKSDKQSNVLRAMFKA